MKVTSGASTSETNAYIKPRVPDLRIRQTNVITDPDLERDIVDALLREYQKKTREPINTNVEFEKIKKTMNAIVVDKSRKEVVRIDNEGQRVTHTIIYVQILPKNPGFWDYAFGLKKVKNIIIIEHIPKESASNLGHVRFANKDYMVVNDDPIIAWNLTSLDKPTEFSYEVDRKTDKEGNTLIIGTVTRGFPYVVLVLIIPLIIVLLLLFDKFRKKPDEEIFDLKDKPPAYEKIEDEVLLDDPLSESEQVRGEKVDTMGDFDKLIDGVEDYIARRLDKGDHRDLIKEELVKRNWPSDIIEKLIQKHEQIRSRR
jgi:hypothetical protein